MHHLAIDIGASSGRIFSGKIIGDPAGFHLSDRKIQIDEIYRFENNIIHRSGHCFWDVDLLFNHIIEGLQEAADSGITTCTVGIDTWGVDYVLIDSKGNRITDVFCYRDSRTDDAMASFHELISREEIYSKTGIQFLQFNTLYQLFSHHKDDLKRTNKILLIPDYLYYLFTGKCFNEVTNASTTQLLNLSEREFDTDLLSTLGINRNLFAELIHPGNPVGKIKPELREKYNLPECEFVSVATHDTGSAVLGAPLLQEGSVYLSSGTWSLLGIENQYPVNTSDALIHNFTNEWGAGNTYRFLKNLTGLWLIQEVKRNYDDIYSYENLMKKAEMSESLGFLINCNDNCFQNPLNMIEAIRDYCKRTGQKVPVTASEIARCIIDSLALSYRHAVEEIEQLTGKNVNMVNIIGGGVKNSFLCQTTADISGKMVTAGPVEATAIGNLIVQMIAAGEISSISEARRVISESFISAEFSPKITSKIDIACERYKNLIKQ